MAQRGKVIRGLEAHANPKTCETCAGEECPYYNRGGGYTEVTCSSFLAADALALLKEQKARWIPVTERLPKRMQDVLVVSNGNVMHGYLGPMGLWYTGFLETLDDVTHWMPNLVPPEPPKEEDDA